MGSSFLTLGTQRPHHSGNSVLPLHSPRFPTAVRNEMDVKTSHFLIFTDGMEPVTMLRCPAELYTTLLSPPTPLSSPASVPHSMPRKALTWALAGLLTCLNIITHLHYRQKPRVTDLPGVGGEPPSTVNLPPGCSRLTLQNCLEMVLLTPH